jgi:hypothetical protein
MDLVDRYVHAVKRHLPAKQQDDIANELTDDILSQIRDKEEELGRPLSDEEQEAVLKQYGHPYLLAMRYRPQQYLIGPSLFQFYVPALKLALALAFAVQVIVALSVGLSQNAPGRILGWIARFPGVALQVCFWVTVVFAVADYWQAKLRLFEKWSPRALPPVSKGTRPSKPVNMVIEVVANLIFVAWWLALPTYPFLMFGPAAAFLTFSSAWSRVYYVGFIPAIVSTLLALVILVRPSWAWLPRVRSLATNVLSLVVLSVAMHAGDLIIPLKESAELARLVRGINDLTTVILVIISLVTMAQALIDVYRLVRSPSS